MSPVPRDPKIYHIIHIDKLASIIETGGLYSDKIVQEQGLPGTIIGMTGIKERRMKNMLNSHPSLSVGDCVPFYFCTRSVMLFIIHCANHVDLNYREGQGNILHLQADLHTSINWADSEDLRWAITLSNAGAAYFEDRDSVDALSEINWEAVNAIQWSGRGIDSKIREGKQAEFLIESKFPWQLVSKIGIPRDQALFNKIQSLLQNASHKPVVTYEPDWYY